MEPMLTAADAAKCRHARDPELGAANSAGPVSGSDRDRGPPEPYTRPPPLRGSSASHPPREDPTPTDREARIQLLEIMPEALLLGSLAPPRQHAMEVSPRASLEHSDLGWQEVVGFSRSWISSRTKEHARLSVSTRDCCSANNPESPRNAPQIGVAWGQPIVKLARDLPCTALRATVQSGCDEVDFLQN